MNFPLHYYSNGCLLYITRSYMNCESKIMNQWNLQPSLRGCKVTLKMSVTHKLLTVCSVRNSRALTGLEGRGCLHGEGIIVPLVCPFSIPMASQGSKMPITRLALLEPRSPTSMIAQRLVQWTGFQNLEDRSITHFCKFGALVVGRVMPSKPFFEHHFLVRHENRQRNQNGNILRAETAT